MHESKYITAKQDTRTFSLTNLYSNPIYSSYKALRPVKDILLPIAVQKQMVSAKFGFVDETTIWISKGGLWFYDIAEDTHEFVANIEVEAMVPISGDMIETWDHAGKGVLMITGNSSAIYGFENGTLLETRYKFPLRGNVRCTTAHGATIFIGYDTGLEMIYYNGYGFYSSFCSGYGFLFSRSTLCGNYVAADSNFAVYADKYKFHIFSIKGGLRHLHTGEIQKYTLGTISGCGIVESKENFVLFYLMDSENARIFFNLLNIPSFWRSKQNLTHVFTKAGPFSEFSGHTSKRIKMSSPSLDDETNGFLQGNGQDDNDKRNFIRGDKIFMFRKNKIGLVSFNEDQKVNPDASRAVENFSLVPFSRPVRAAMLGKHLYVLSDNSCHVIKIISGHEQFINARPDEIHKLINAYGEREAAVNYLHLIATGHEVGYSVARMINESAVYSYFAQILSPLAGDLKDKTRSFYDKLESINYGLKNILKFKNIPPVKELHHALNYLKILREYQPDQLYGDFEKAVFGEKAFKKRTLVALLECNKEQMLKIVEERCNGYFSLGQIYHRKGIEIIKNPKHMNSLNALNQSLECFKKSDENLKPVVKIYNKNKFFTGSAVLLKRQNLMYHQNRANPEYSRTDNLEVAPNGRDKIQKVEVGDIVESLGCKGALSTFLENETEDFTFQVLDAALLKFKRNDVSFLKTECACCKYEKPTEILSITDFFGIKTPFFESFLKNKFENTPDDYDFLWKFYFYHKRKNEAQSILVRIAEEKSLPILKRFQYLNKAFYIGDYDADLKRKIKLAQIQLEVQDRLQKLSLDELLDEDELFNKYTIPFNFADLSLRIIDITDFDNLSALTNIWKAYLTTDYDTALENLQNLKICGGALNIDAIGQALLDINDILEDNNCKEDDYKRYNKKHRKDLHSILIEAGFTASEIQFFLKRCLYNKNLDKAKKRVVLRNMEKYFADDFAKMNFMEKCVVKE